MLFKYRLKILLRDKINLFFTLCFPLILGTLYYFAFGNLSNLEIDQIKISIINDDLYFKEVLNGIDLIEIVEVKNTNEANALLDNKEIDAYFLDYDIIALESGINQNILKSITNSYLQKVSASQNIDISSINAEANYLKTISSSNQDFSVIYFYALFGMICMFGGFFSISILNEVEPDSNSRARRFSISPVKKSRALFSFLGADLLIHFTEICIALAYFTLVLKIDFSDNFIKILILCFIGSLAGFGLGCLCSVLSKGSFDSKVNKLVLFSLVGTFLSGGMIFNVRYIISKYIPFINYLNPVGLITDGFYSLYYYSKETRYYQNLLYLTIFVLISMVVTFIVLRRKRYDSL